MTADPPATRRRQVLAFLALADAPTPDKIQFDYYRQGQVAIEVGSTADAAAWRAAFSAEADWRASEMLFRPAKNDRPAYLNGVWRLKDWRGWEIRIEADEPAGSPGELDAATLDQLATVLTAPAGDREDLVDEEGDERPEADR